MYEVYIWDYVWMWGPVKWAWGGGWDQSLDYHTRNCRLWDSCHRNMQGKEMGLTGCQFPGQWFGIRCDPVPLPAQGNLVSFWIGNIFFFSLASSQRNCSSDSLLNTAYNDSGLRGVWKHLFRGNGSMAGGLISLWDEKWPGRRTAHLRVGGD